MCLDNRADDVFFPIAATKGVVRSALYPIVVFWPRTDYSCPIHSHPSTFPSRAYAFRLQNAPTIIGAGTDSITCARLARSKNSDHHHTYGGLFCFCRIYQTND